MKSLLLLFLVLTFSHPTIPYLNTDSVVKKVSDKLNRLSEVSYTYTFNARYFSEDYQRDFITNVYIKFNEQNSIGLIFQDTGQNHIHVYNGDTMFEIEKKKGTIERINKPNSDSFNSKIFLVNSFPTLRKFLPVLLTKKPKQISVSDTTIQGKRYTTASFTLKDTMLHRLGYVTPLDIKKNITYTIVIENDLPYMVVQRDNLNPKDYMSVTFTDISVDSKRPSPDSWRYETYASQYKSVN